jgi:hypothetical protein
MIQETIFISREIVKQIIMFAGLVRAAGRQDLALLFALQMEKSVINLVGT